VLVLAALVLSSWTGGSGGELAASASAAALPNVAAPVPAHVSRLAVDRGACPSVALGSKVKLRALTWDAPFRADVRSGSDGKLLGYIQAELGSFHSHMSFFTPDGKLVAMAQKPVFTWGVDRTTIVDCHGKELLRMEQLQARNKYNAVSTYEIDDKDDDELARSQFYYQLGSGDFKINAVKGDQSGENLLKADSPGVWGDGGDNLPPTWTVQLKSPMDESPLADDVPGLLLWLAEEERGMWGLPWGVSVLISCIMVACLVALYLVVCVARVRSGRSRDDCWDYMD
jgi:hypothetical protein